MIRNTLLAILISAFIGGVFVDSHTPPPPREIKPAPKTKTAEVRVIYRGISRQHLESVIYNVLAFLGEKNRNDWTRLLLLTAMTESDCGRLLKQVKGPAQGIMQTEPETERDVLRWTRTRYPALYERVRLLRVPAHLDIHEAQYNLGYSIALAYLEYIHRKVSPVGKSHQDLAKLYKRHYNTPLGKGTVKGAIKKSQDLDDGRSPWLMVEGL